MLTAALRKNHSLTHPNLCELRTVSRLEEEGMKMELTSASDFALETEIQKDQHAHCLFSHVG
jgi:hypothetical protein